MADDQKPILSPNREQKGESSTTSLLKKRREGQETGELATTGPVTSRLAEIAHQTPEKSSKKGLYIGIGIGAVVVVILAVVLSTSGGLGLMSGGKGLGAGTGEAGGAERIGADGKPVPPTPPPTDPNAPKPAPRAQELGGYPFASGGSASVGLPSMPSGGMTSPGYAPPPPTPAAPTPAAPASRPAAQPAASQPVAAAPAPRPTPPPAATAPRPDAVSLTPATPATAEVTRGMTVASSDPEAVKPSPMSAIAARKPVMAQNARKSGQARIYFLVDENGTVAQARVMSETPPGLGFGEAAAAAIRSTRFRPATKHGVPVKMWMTQILNFQ